MPTEPSPFIWYELMTTDPTAASAFYGAVVGWTVTDSGQPGMDYRIIQAGSSGIGGVLTLPPNATGMEPGWFGYVAVPDVDATIAAVTQSGGSLCMPATDIPMSAASP